MTRRDQGIVGALVATFIVLALVIALPPADLAIGPGATRPPVSALAQGSGEATTSTDGTASSPPGSAGPDGSAEPTAVPSVASASTAPTEPPVPVIRQGILGMPASINPLTPRTQADRDLVALVFSGLVRLGPKDTLLPDLADRWSADTSGSHWTFHIRSTAVWHDGVPVTADDVVVTLALLRDPEYTGPSAGSWNEITVKKLDRLTVRFDLETPLGDFLQLTRQPLLPAHLLKDVPIASLAASAFSLSPVGAGPYRLLQWDSATALLEQATVVQPPAPVGPGPVASPDAGIPPRLQLFFYPTVSALASAYGAGELDMADGLPAAMAQELDALPRTSVVRNPRSTLTAVLLNLRTDHPTIRDDQVRQALMKAIDRVTLVEEVLGGFGNRADTLIPPTSWAYVKKAAAPQPYSTTRAARQLQAAGWRKVNGKWHTPGSKNIFTIELLTTTEEANPITWAAAQFVARSWRSFGVTVKVVGLAPNVLIGQRLSEADFTAAVVDMNIGLDPDLYPLLASRQAGIGGSNLSGVQSLVLDDLLVAARRPGTLAQRRGAWAKLEKFLSDAQPTLPLAFRDDPMVVSGRVIGPRPHLQGDQSDRFWDVLTWRLASAG